MVLGLLLFEATWSMKSQTRYFDPIVECIHICHLIQRTFFVERGSPCFPWLSSKCLVCISLFGCDEEIRLYGVDVTV